MSVKHPHCRAAGCQLKEHKGYDSCSRVGQCAWLEGTEAPTPITDKAEVCWSEDESNADAVEDILTVSREMEERAYRAEAALAALAADLSATIELLRWAKCPECDGSGSIPRQISDYEWGAEQCEWCFDRNAAVADRSKKNPA